MSHTHARESHRQLACIECSIKSKTSIKLLIVYNVYCGGIKIFLRNVFGNFKWVTTGASLEHHFVFKRAHEDLMLVINYNFKFNGKPWEFIQCVHAQALLHLKSIFLRVLDTHLHSSINSRNFLNIVF